MTMRLGVSVSSEDFINPETRMDSIAEFCSSIARRACVLRDLVA